MIGTVYYRKAWGKGEGCFTPSSLTPLARFSDFVVKSLALFPRQRVTFLM